MFPMVLAVGGVDASEISVDAALGPDRMCRPTPGSVKSKELMFFIPAGSRLRSCVITIFAI